MGVFGTARMGQKSNQWLYVHLNYTKFTGVPMHLYINRTASVLCHFVVAITLATITVFLIGTFANVIQW